MNQHFKNNIIESIASCVPKSIVGNAMFNDLLNEKERKFFEKTVGILERRWANSDITASDLGEIAAKEIFKNTTFSKDRIKAIIFLSQTSDYKIPFTSNILQRKLGLSTSVLCLDINAGCAGFIQGLSTSFALLNTLNEDEKVLFIVAETLSKILSSEDRSTTMLFGDGASAMILGKNNNSSDTYINHFSDGANFDAIIIPDGGYRNCINKGSLEQVIDSANNKRSKINLSMDGPRVFDFTLREVAPSIMQLLEFNKLSIDDIDYLLLHQSNRFIIKQIASKLGMSEEKVLININKYGNTSGVTIPLLITDNYDKFQNAGAVMFSGYGSGLNWGNCITTLKETNIFPIIEY
jgi:3-oxoacyl-[acyl-carrier-protein] synthase-3